MFIPRSGLKHRGGHSSFEEDTLDDASLPQAASPPSLFARRRPDRMYGDPQTPEDRDRKERQRLEWLAALDHQVREKKRRAEEEENRLRRYEEVKEREAREYNPFGRPGGGAPLKDGGHVLSDLSRAKRAGILEGSVVDPSFDYHTNHHHAPLLQPMSTMSGRVSPIDPKPMGKKVVKQGDTSKDRRKQELLKQLEHERKAVAELETKLQYLKGADMTESRPASATRTSHPNAMFLQSIKEFIREENAALRQQLDRQEEIIRKLVTESSEVKVKNAKLVEEMESLRTALVQNRVGSRSSVSRSRVVPTTPSSAAGGPKSAKLPALHGPTQPAPPPAHPISAPNTSAPPGGVQPHPPAAGQAQMKRKPAVARTARNAMPSGFLS